MEKTWQGMFGGMRSMPDHKAAEQATEQSWIERTQRKDFEGFAKIVDAYHARVHGFVFRMVREQEEAQDITQEVFVRAFQAIDRFDGRSSLRTWLFRIAYNLCVDRSRKKDRTPFFQSLDATVGDEEPAEISDVRWEPSTVMLNEELFQVVEEALTTMSDKLRNVLYLHDKEELGYEEIAAISNIPVGTVKSRLFLARAHLQAAINRYQQTGSQS